MNVRVGISGWRYAGWRGKFYPPGLPQKQELAYAGSRFHTLEINGSFYALQKPESYARWRREVPEGFVFSVKGSRYITHMRRLRDSTTPLANFLASGIFALEEKLGPILWQLPPTMKYDREQLAAFLDLLPHTGADAAKLAHRHDARVTGRARLSIDPKFRLRHALEVRHESFVQAEFIESLRQRGIALVIADTAGKWPFLEDVTADFVYVRLHGGQELYTSGYTDDALDGWAHKIRAWRGGGQPEQASRASTKPPPRRKSRDVFVYFDNDAKVHAPFDAMRLAEMLH